MPAGTIALTNGSTAVTGTGTSFTSELKAGDFVYVTVGGSPYTLVASTVGSDTQLTLAVAFDGPTTSGLAWNAVPASLQVAITQKILNDFASVARGRILDFQNWQKIYSSDASVTVTRPDRTQFTGPSWGYMADQYASKASKGANSDITSITGLTTALSIAQGGTGQKTAATAWNALAQYGSVANTAAQGNDSRLNTVNGKSGGTVSTGLAVSAKDTSAQAFIADVLSQEGTSGNYTNRMLYGYGTSTTYDVAIQYRLLTGQYHYTRIVQNGIETFTARSNGACYAVSFNPTSDSNLKFNKSFIDSALMKSMSLRGMTYDINGERKAGVIAQDAQGALPESVTRNTEAVVLEDGTILNETLSLDYSAVAGLHVEAIKELIPLMLEMLNDPESAKTKLTSLIAAVNTSTKDANATDMKMEWSLLNPPTTPVLEEVNSEDGQEKSEEIGS